MKRYYIPFLIPFFAFISPAVAADVPETDSFAEPDVPTSTGFDWTGFYVGLQAGYEWHDGNYNDPFNPIAEGTYDFDGLVAGVHAGYDWQYNQFVLGIVGDIEWMDGSQMSPSPTLGGLWGGASANWQASVRGRAGYASNNILVYATGGVAFGNYDFDFGGPGLANAFQDGFTDTVVGYTVGGGGAYAFNPYWNAWIDYRYTDYGTATSGIANCCAGPPDRQDHDIQTHAVRIGVSRILK